MAFKKYEDLASLEFPDANKAKYFGKFGQKKFEQESASAKRNFDTRKLIVDKEEADRKESESLRRWNHDNAQQDMRTFLPIQEATDSAYSLIASTPITERAQVDKQPIRSELTRAESVRRMLKDFPKANLDDPRIQDILRQRPEHLQDVPMAESVDWAARAGVKKDEGGPLSFIKDMVRSGVAGLGKLASGMNFGGGAPNSPAAAISRGAPKPPDFSSVEAAEAAGLPAGTKITIQGRPAVYE